MRGFNSRLITEHKEEYEEYVAALCTYKLACKEFTKIRQRYKSSTVPQERLVYYEARDKYALACRTYNDARAKWERLVTKVRLQVEHGDALGMDLTKLLGVKIPLSIKELAEANKNRVVEESFKPGELERLKVEFRRASDKRSITRLNFMVDADEEVESSDKDPTAGDFEPLP